MQNTSRRRFLTYAASGAVAAPLGARTRPRLAPSTPVDLGYPDGACRVGLNENPLGASPRALRAMTEALQQAHRYPKPQPLADKLAKHHGVDPEWVVLASGSSELLRNIPPALAVDGEIVTAREAYRSVPSTAEKLRIPCRMVPVDAALRHDLKAMAEAINPRTRVVLVCNPNNPTGTVLSAAELRAFADAVPREAVYVVDEAYIQFAPQADVMGLVKGRNNVLVLRTFSKAYGLAGMRVGYAVGHPDVVKKLRALSLVYNVSTVAYAGALAALEDTDHVERSRAHVRECRQFYDRAMAPWGRRYVPSETTFFLLESGEEGDEVERRLGELGVFIRRGTDWDLPIHIRVSYGTMEENRAVVAALRRTLRPQT